MKKYRTLKNRNNVNVDMYICETEDEKYIIAISELLKNNAEMFVETYNSGNKQRKNYEENVQDAISEHGNQIENMALKEKQ